MHALGVTIREAVDAFILAIIGAVGAALVVAIIKFIQYGKRRDEALTKLVEHHEEDMRIIRRWMKRIARHIKLHDRIGDEDNDKWDDGLH